MDNLKHNNEYKRNTITQQVVAQLATTTDSIAPTLARVCNPCLVHKFNEGTGYKPAPASGVGCI